MHGTRAYTYIRSFISICIMAGCFICMKLDEQRGAYSLYAVVDEEEDDDDDDVVVNVNWFIVTEEAQLRAN